MQIDWETFQAAYQAATPEQKQVIDSDRIYDCVSAAIITYNQSPEHSRELIKITSLVVLEAITQQDALKKLTALGITDQQIVFNSITACLEKKTAQVDTQPVAAPSTVLHIRTMANDVRQAAQEERVYHSSQDTILKRPSTIAQEIANPQWESAKE